MTRACGIIRRVIFLNALVKLCNIIKLVVLLMLLVYNKLCKINNEGGSHS